MVVIVDKEATYLKLKHKQLNEPKEKAPGNKQAYDPENIKEKLKVTIKF